VIDVHQQTDDAAALIRALELSPAVVIGRSQGGEIAVDLALRYPDRIRALALLEGGGMSLSPEFARWSKQVLAPVFAGGGGRIAGRRDDVSRGPRRRRLGRAPGRGAPGVRREQPAILAEEQGALLEVTEAQLRTIDRPVLVVGARDSGPAFADVAERTARAIPTARLEWVDGSHLIDAAHPAALAFVDEVTSVPAPLG
jgi:pimeloyl-ACP methyl ester carboxylesterase